MTIELLAEVSLLRDKVMKYEKAWENVKKEIINLADEYDFYSDTRRINGLRIALEIINKHLKEVENE